MAADDEFDDGAEELAGDQWENFRCGDSEPIGIAELGRLPLHDMPQDVRISVMDDYFPETTIWREDEFLVCEIQEHLYTKYWEHKFSAYAFAEAMERAVRRLGHEGHPLENPVRDDEDVHIFVRWKLRCDIEPLRKEGFCPDSVCFSCRFWRLIGGAKAMVSFSGLAPGFVGLYQINAEIPAGLSAGNQLVMVILAEASSNSVVLPVL